MRLGALAVALACGACDTGVHAVPLGPLDASPACEEAKSHSDLAYIQTEIFDHSCASSTACHKTAIDDSANLSLADGKSWTDLVNVNAQSKVAVMPVQWVRVVPFQPSLSYLMVVIDPMTNPVPNGPSDPNGYVGPLDKGVGSMPQNAGELLCPEKIAAVERWINAGAPAQ
jgi:hypothetical protein